MTEGQEDVPTVTILDVEFVEFYRCGQHKECSRGPGVQTFNLVGRGLRIHAAVTHGEVRLGFAQLLTEVEQRARIRQSAGILQVFG